jgi:Sec-independent protein translocase protein TatA
LTPDYGRCAVASGGEVVKFGSRLVEICREISKFLRTFFENAKNFTESVEKIKRKMKTPSENHNEFKPQSMTEKSESASRSPQQPIN